MQAFEAKPPPLELGPDGTIRVASSRVSLETVVGAFDAGATAEEIAQQYPSILLSNVYAVIAYVLDNRAAVNAYVIERRNAGAAAQAQIEAHSPPEGFRARLIARHSRAAGG